MGFRGVSRMRVARVLLHRQISAWSERASDLRALEHGGRLSSGRLSADGEVGPRGTGCREAGSTCHDWQLDVCPQSLALPSYLRYAPSHVLPTTLATPPHRPIC